MVNFGPLAAEIVSLVWGTPGNFNGFRVLATLLHGTLVVCVSQTAALNRGCHLYSAGRPSRWALAYILVKHILRLVNCCKILLLQQNQHFYLDVSVSIISCHVSSLSWQEPEDELNKLLLMKVSERPKRQGKNVGCVEVPELW